MNTAQPVERKSKLTLNDIFLGTAGFLSFGISLIILTAFWDSIAKHNELIMRVFTLCVICLSLSLTAYVCINIFLSLQRRAIENQFYSESKQELIVKKQIEHDPESDEEIQSEIEQKVLKMYKENASLNQMALEVYGKRGGAYNNKIREILEPYGVEI